MPLLFLRGYREVRVAPVDLSPDGLLLLRWVEGRLFEMPEPAAGLASGAFFSHSIANIGPSRNIPSAFPAGCSGTTNISGLR